jgi:hypothetical protein
MPSESPTFSCFLAIFQESDSPGSSPSVVGSSVVVVVGRGSSL